MDSSTGTKPQESSPCYLLLHLPGTSACKCSYNKREERRQAGARGGEDEDGRMRERERERERERGEKNLSESERKPIDFWLGKNPLATSPIFSHAYTRPCIHLHPYYAWSKSHLQITSLASSPCI